MSGFYTKDGLCVLYTKLGWQRMKGLRFREDKGWDDTKSGDIGNESQVHADDWRIAYIELGVIEGWWTMGSLVAGK